MHVMILGLRGIPNVQGGVETHVEHLGPLLAKQGFEIEVLTRSPYVDGRKAWQGVKLTRLWAPKTNGVEALIHTFLGTLYAGVRRPDVLHIHAVGPMIMVPLAKLMGLKVVVTHHGPDYDRDKWGGFARNVLRVGERLGIRYADARISISKLIKQHLQKSHGKSSVLIKNGVTEPSSKPNQQVLKRFGIDSTKYILQVSRFVPEKRQTDLINGFRKANLQGWKLVLVGDIGGGNSYEREVIALCEGRSDVILTGYQSGGDLDALYENARLFVLPSSHEGLPIAMLEALSYGLRVLASDIGANKEVGLPHDQYFPVGDVDALAQRLSKASKVPWSASDRSALRQRVLREYDWEDIARATGDVYKKLARPGVAVGV